jgi:hypothetical protein
MTDKVAVHGGYVWSYLADGSRRWGEMEAYPTMIWTQAPGTPEMGQIFLDAYHATGDEQYYRAAEQAADALIAGQHPAGGWNYIIDFAGEDSLKRWYETIGKNGWRLEEFQHYYGNATFDDHATVECGRFLLRLHLEKGEAKYRAAVDKAVGFVLDSQYSNGGWPQRFPRMGQFSNHGRPDYTGFITLNDEVAEENIELPAAGPAAAQGRAGARAADPGDGVDHRPAAAAADARLGHAVHAGPEALGRPDL